MNNRIILYISLILSLLLLLLMALFLLPFFLGPLNLVQFSWQFLYLADRILGGLVPLPPVVSWMVFGFCLGVAMELFIQDLEQPSKLNRITRRVMLGGVLGWALAGQYFMNELTNRRSTIQVRQWWRPETYRSPGTPRVVEGIELRWIPPGTFIKGSPLTEEGRNIDEVQREITISRGYWIGAKEITWKEWLKCMPPPAGHPEPPEDRELPVWGISIEEAEAFCQALSAKGHGIFRLPTENEWEYACRAGTTTAYFFGDDARKLAQYACAGGKSSTISPPEPCRASTTRANPWGLMDVHGNVAEWCAAEPADRSALSYRVYRGGSWLSPSSACRAAARGIHLISQPPPEDVGLRVIWEP